MNRKAKARRTGQPANFGGEDNNFLATASSVGRLHFSFNSTKKASPVFAASDAPLRASQKPCSLDDWIGLIRESCSRGATSTFELDRLMSKARRTLPYGSWSQLWRSGGLPFSKRKGEKLVVIGRGLEGLDANKCSHLPAAWNTLYYLARLDRKTVERLIAQGRIHPGLSLREAKALLAEFHPETPGTSLRSKLQNRLARFAAFVRSEMGAWSAAEREMISRQLAVLVREIQASLMRAHRAAKVARFDSPRFGSVPQPIPGLRGISSIQM